MSGFNHPSIVYVCIYVIVSSSFLFAQYNESCATSPATIIAYCYSAIVKYCNLGIFNISVSYLIFELLRKELQHVLYDHTPAGLDS